MNYNEAIKSMREGKKVRMKTWIEGRYISWETVFATVSEAELSRPDNWEIYEDTADAVNKE